MDPATFDVMAMRAHFPALREGGAAHFDGPGGSQTPDVVAKAIYDTMTSPLSNRGRFTPAERNADQVVAGCRAAVADLVGADPSGVVFGRSMTALTYDFAQTMAKDWSVGDEVVVSRLDHDSNIRPWITVAERAGAVVKWADFDPASGELAPEVIAGLLTERTKVVAVTAASNLIGTMPDLASIGGLVHAVGAWFYVDGVHFTAHHRVDVASLGADFYACSPYKFLGPHCGVVTARPDLLGQLRPDKLLPSSDSVPERFELGTLPYELMAGTTAAIDFLAAAVPTDGTRRDRLLRSMHAIEDYEADLAVRLEAALSGLPGLTCFSRAARRTPTLLVQFDGHDATDIQRFLAERNVNAPAGSFYALEASRHLGLGDTGGLRIGLSPYTTAEDVDRLLDALTGYFG